MNYFKQPDETSSIPKSALILISVLTVSIISLVVLIVSQLAGSKAQKEADEFVPVARVAQTDLETVVSTDQVILYVPQRAFDLSGSFAILPRQPNLFSYASEPEWSRPVVVDIQYRNADGVPYPGVAFSEPVSICFKLSSDQWLDFTSRPDDYQVQYFDDGQVPSRWLAFPTVIDVEEYRLCTQTNHLSIYALAVKNQELIPNTGTTTFPTAILPPTAGVITSPKDNNRNDNPEVTPPPTEAPPIVPPIELPPILPPGLLSGLLP